jgi:hypothetical protein
MSETARTLASAVGDRQYLDHGPTARVPIGSLAPADSPRLTGESDEHAAVLAESDVNLPPIVVHRPTMRVIDGMHRLRAAALRGEDEITARFFDGPERDAFVLGVELNVAHGLPLSRADRVVAATRIIGSHPMWSDRMIAAATGLSPGTVAAVRKRSTEPGNRSNIRRGRDGRVRPVNGADGRRLAAELMAAHPNASLREIAEKAGIAASTALDVRRRLRTGEDPVAPRRRGSTARTPGDNLDLTAALDILRRDPSLRFTEAGRTVLRWLDAYPANPAEWDRLASQLPSHSLNVVADLAAGTGRTWLEFANRLHRRAQRPGETSPPHDKKGDCSETIDP